MSSHGVSIDRVTGFFRESSLDTVRVTFQLVKEIVEGRLASARKSAATQAAVAEVPRKKRRTKAEMEADAAKAKGGQRTIEEGAKDAGAPGTLPL